MYQTTPEIHISSVCPPEPKFMAVTWRTTSLTSCIDNAVQNTHNACDACGKSEENLREEFAARMAHAAHRPRTQRSAHQKSDQTAAARRCGFYSPHRPGHNGSPFACGLPGVRCRQRRCPAFQAVTRIAGRASSSLRAFPSWTTLEATRSRPRPTANRRHWPRMFCALRTERARRVRC